MTTARVRIGVGALGALVTAYGAWLILSRQDLDQLVSAALWLVGGVVVHDFVLAPLVLVLAWVFRGLADSWRRPVTVAVVVLGSLSLLAVPVLGRFGARPDNPTLLDRPYGWSWVAVLVATLVLVGVAGLIGSRTTRRPVPAQPVDDEGGDDGSGARGR